jgi:DUF1680 family protein
MSMQGCIEMQRKRCDRIAGTVYRIDGILGGYLRNVSEQWLKTAPLANPAILEMFRDRDRRPRRDMVPWAGEFAGKYLTSAVQVLRLTGDPELRGVIEAFVRELVTLQADNGYLGPWPAECGLTNRSPTPRGGSSTWDSWGHYHITLGLLLWYEDTNDEDALNTARRIADRLCEMYLGAKSPRLVDTGSTEMNLAPAHSMALLYRFTEEPRYLQLAEQIVAEFAAVDDRGRPLAGNYLEGPLAGLEFFELTRPRWESLHAIMALSELSLSTGRKEYGDAFQAIWWSITRTDRHNTGGFSSGEKANGNPYDLGAIETCCTIAWIALSVEMLRLTGDARVADELELSTLNSVIGMHSFSGRWVTYDTPPDGKRFAFYTAHPWQGREGSPELNCCSVNGPRGFGMVSDWALVRDDRGLVLNWYGPSSLTARLTDSVDVTLRQRTDYPWDGRIELTVAPSAPADFCLKLRIPRWSTTTRVAINGESVDDVAPGVYLALERRWQSGDTVEIDLDMFLHMWTGELERAGKTSIYRGPILLTYDRRYNDVDPDDLPLLDARNLAYRHVDWPHWLPPAMLLEFTTRDDGTLRLCDFGSAGEGGTPYKSWLSVENVDADGPRYFAPAPAERLRADMGRYAVLYASFRAMDHIGSQPWGLALVRLRHGWPAFVRSCDNARKMIDTHPDAPGARALADALARVERESDLMDPAFLDHLDREQKQADPAPPCTLTDFGVSELKSPVADIRKAGLPAQSESFRTIQPADRNHWFDVNAVHGGLAGLVYLRATVNLPRATAGQLHYGADGPVKVWVNGLEVGCRTDAVDPAKPAEYLAQVDWVEGDNSLVFALDTAHGHAWGIHVTAAAEGGSRQEG